MSLIQTSKDHNNFNSKDRSNKEHHYMKVAENSFHLWFQKPSRDRLGGGGGVGT